FNEKIQQAFEPIHEFAKLFGAEIHLLRVVTRDDFYYTGPMIERMQSFAKKNKVSKFTCNVYNAEKIQEGINEFANSIGADMIATATHGRKGLARLLNGSIAEGMNKSAALPVMSSKI